MARAAEIYPTTLADPAGTDPVGVKIRDETRERGLEH
jgi:hypothetical protein